MSFSVSSTASLISEIPPTANEINSPDLNFSINNRINRTIPESDEEETVVTIKSNDYGGCSNGEDCCSRKTTITTVVDIEDMSRKASPNGGGCIDTADDEPIQSTSGLCSTNFNCNGASRKTCQTLLNQYNYERNDELEPLEFPEEVDDHQTMRHTVLLILLLCAMFVGLALSIWTLVMEGMSGIYIELVFLDGFLNFGQSLIVLGCFITNTVDLFLPFAKYWRKIWYGANTLNLPDWSNVSAETKQICEQFKTYHLEVCRKTIANDKRWRIKIYKKVFYGSAFVDWLLLVGLAKDRIEAAQYAGHLIDGRVLRHINNVYHFHDKNLLYTFCSRL